MSEAVDKFIHDKKQRGLWFEPPINSIQCSTMASHHMVIAEIHYKEHINKTLNTHRKDNTWDKEPPEMVKKVGEALKEQCLKEFGSTWDNDTTWNLAQAAIEAMREPSKDLKKNFGQAMISNYQAMINKALEEGE